MHSKTLVELRTVLDHYPQLGHKSCDPVHVSTLLRHINAGKVKLWVSEGQPFILSHFAVVNVHHTLSKSITLHLVEAKNDSHQKIRRIRPDIGINVRVIESEKPEHAARRALREKLGVTDFSSLEFVGRHAEMVLESKINRLFSRNVMLVYNYEIPKGFYDPHGYVFKNNSGKNVLFEWVPIQKKDEHEHQIFP